MIPRNRLTQAGSATYAYDAEDCRIAKTENGVSTTYIHDPHAPFSRLLQKTTGGDDTFYVYAGSQLLYEEYNGTIKVYHFDKRGSTRAMSDNTGNVLTRITYGTYGELVNVTSPIDTPFLFNGAYGVQTDENGLLFMRARYYSTETRRFFSDNPIGFLGGSNWYIFAASNPFLFVDPLGLLVEVIYDPNTSNLAVTDLETGQTVSATAHSGGDPYGDPIPTGRYEILERAGNDSFRLDAIDRKPRNDIHEPTGRYLFRRHGPGRTIGCIECIDETEYRNVLKVIESTSTELVEVTNRTYWLRQFLFAESKEKLSKFGELEVKEIK